MAVGKNRKLGKKGRKKKVVDPFLKKDWYTVQAPSMFTHRDAGLTLCTRTQGTKIASETLKNRVFEVSLADLNDNAELAYRKIRLCCDDVQGDKVLTNFHGMDMTRDKLCSLIKKWQTLIEARVDVRTTDGYTLRLFCIGFTQKNKNQIKKTWYAQAGQVRQIRKKMVDIMTAECVKCDLKELVAKFVAETIGKEIEKAAEGIYPIQNCYIRKVKLLKKPKFDLVKLMELHADTGNDVGAKVDREDPAVKEETVAGSGGRY
uniref:Small ribosomal subunit protein eS1 n=1 Tax=Mucochytrium quahogii TaxID=96639 RepID=A0A7S2W4V3_9STRA|mmetsp:Transcript_16963/g.27456  ORF Transcript_16963/g.27456 Transcript_16963/m.27456 type:complete len:261 (+) Transcript_16963:69-851(+)|eukprot:CAMPEP_0203749702 /NCGR_PEP_ID=MMETSP0098-20131031/4150_1 /ASSEMBLY_ACC=CAM_ASM_000208 /TAXON_ID=96639 /ORGANISM=" , Strain NY0313808BC1" /LENGTH=260 /DNA_ID=CAMNT_0050638795 /DNA_START=5500 /DNA_END=6282 /DNA_ORIENTATION=-